MRRKYRLSSDIASHGLIELLASLPLDARSKEGRLVEVSETFVGEYTGSLRPNTWLEAVGSAARIELLPASAAKHASRLLLLQGTERAVELAEEALQKLESDFGRLGTRPKQAHTSKVQPCSVSSIDSVASFSQFVIQSTHRYVPRGIHKELGRSWNQAVAGVLARMFQDPTTSKHASTVALNHALRFLCRHSELFETALLLHRCAQSLRLGLDISTYNLLLQSALKLNNIVETRSLLLEMRLSGIPANSHTWSLFFTATQSGDKLHVLRAMKRKGVVMAPASMATIREAALRDLFPTSKPSAQNIQSLLAQLDDVFGPDWMTIDSYHQLLRLCGSHVHKETINFLECLPLDRKFQPNSQTRLYVAALAQRQGVTKESLSVFMASLAMDDPVKMRLAVPLLFTTAWNACCYSICSLLWTFAATRGLITYKMQSAVNKHLIRNADNNSRTSRRRRIGAKLIPGVLWWNPRSMDQLGTMFPKLKHAFPDCNNPSQWLAQYTPDDGTRDEQLSLAYFILNLDRNAWQDFPPMSLDYLGEMLMESFERDKQWHNDGKLDLKAQGDIAAFLEKASKVPLRFLAEGEVNWTVQKKLDQMQMLRRSGEGDGEDMEVNDKEARPPEPHQKLWTTWDADDDGRAATLDEQSEKSSDRKE